MKNVFVRPTVLLLFAGLTACCITGCFLRKNPNGPDDEKPVEPVFNEDLYNLRLTEIHYNPDDNEEFPGDSIEFLELKNVGESDLSLKDVEFTAGVTYVFADDDTIGSGEYMVLASSAAVFEDYYGFTPDGDYEGVLRNSGELIKIMETVTDSTIVALAYSDTGGWASEADGDGYSLVTVDDDPEQDATGPESWRRSVKVGGSPGGEDIRKEVDTKVFDLRITEIHYHPLDLGNIDGDSLEFIELKNVGSSKIDLTDVAFTNGITFEFPEDAALGAGKFIVLASDSATFVQRYPSVIPFASYKGNLSNTGELVSIADIAADTVIQIVDYNDGGAWPNIADGDGHSLVTTSSDPDAEQNDPARWRPSLKIGGSPGADDPGIALVNEVLTHTDEPELDAIELYNPGNEDVDIGGWCLTDEKDNPVKFRIPGGTVIPAGGFIYFDEDDFNADSSASSFTLDSHGEEVYLVADSLVGCLMGYCHGFSFGEIENGISVGRYVTSEGKEVFTPQKNVTLGEANSGPLVGPLIISEIMYHSAEQVGNYAMEEDAGDYLEITNISGQEVSLSHPDSAELTWKVKGIDFSFPANTTIKSNESVVIASDSTDIDDFRTQYDIGSEVQIFTMQGVLSNSSEKLELMKPEDPFIADSTTDTVATVPYMTFDEVKYSDQKPWPVEADGEGSALHRRSPAEYGNDPASWVAGTPSPGTF